MNFYLGVCVYLSSAATRLLIDGGGHFPAAEPNEANPVLFFSKCFNTKASISFHKLFTQFRVV